ncbi:MAG: response regulator [Magnetococcales bacterium]|nr:response regulator [Magnetococcales bacterium]NGZ26236.1 response regulator [Magnetococcales bacterium]
MVESSHHNKTVASPLVPTPLHGTKRILLVDDTQENHMIVGAYLHDLPYQIRFALHGQEALDIYQTERFDLVLMDVIMPGMDGMETTRRMRLLEQSHGWPRTPIIALTARAMKADEDACLAAGCDLHLSKPIRKALLLEMMENLSYPMEDKQKEDSSSPVVINWQTLLELQEESKASFDHFLDRFRQQMPQRLVAIQQAWQQKDSQLVETTAHKFKGLAATFGADALADGCSQVENLSSPQREEKMEALLANLARQIELYTQTLEMEGKSRLAQLD